MIAWDDPAEGIFGGDLPSVVSRGRPTNVVAMSNISSNDRIDDVAPGDLVRVDRGDGERPFKVVFKDENDGRYIVTFNDDDGETFQLEYPAGTVVSRTLEAKWESEQSGTRDD